MKSVLEELFGGNLSPVDFPLRRSAEYEEIDQKHTEKIAEIEGLLGADGYRHMDELVSLSNHLHSLSGDSNEIDMFCFGAMLMVEILGRSAQLLGED